MCRTDRIRFQDLAVTMILSISLNESNTSEILLKAFQLRQEFVMAQPCSFSRADRCPEHSISKTKLRVKQNAWRKPLSDRTEIVNIRASLQSPSEGEALIFEAHLMVLEDNALITEIIQKIK